MFNEEKVIRVLGYIVYTALLSPIILISIIFMPIVYVIRYTRIGYTVRDAITVYKDTLVNGVKHDINFIKTGKW